MKILNFYQAHGINLKVETGKSLFALTKQHTLELLQILKERRVFIYDVKVLHQKQGAYCNLDEKNTLGNLESLNKKERYSYLEQVIKNYNPVKDIENIVFSFMDNESVKAWNALNKS